MRAVLRGAHKFIPKVCSTPKWLHAENLVPRAKLRRLSTLRPTALRLADRVMGVMFSQTQTPYMPTLSPLAPALLEVPDRSCLGDVGRVPGWAVPSCPKSDALGSVMPYGTRNQRRYEPSDLLLGMGHSQSSKAWQ